MYTGVGKKGVCMYKITKKRELNPHTILMDVEAPYIVKHCLPGQFVIVRVEEEGERIPLTICDYDREAKTVTLVFDVVGASTYKMKDLNEGEYLSDIVGPLGNPSELCTDPIEEVKKKNILFVAGGLGTAPVYPQVKWLKEQGIEATVIIGARDKSRVILEEEFRQVCNKLYITTDDGSYIRKGLVTDVISELAEAGEKFDVCISIGPMIMMKFCVATTKKYNIPTIVSMNPIMVDGTGMCGACRLTVGDEVKFACVDGPEFDGFLVNFEEAMERMKLYKTQEGRDFLKAKEGDTHHGGCGNCS